MPNWCFNNISITSNNKTKLEELFKKIEEWTSKSYCDNSWDHMWLGNIVGFGLDIDPTSADAPSCRGCIDDYSFTGSEINIQTETAWSPYLQMWVKVCEKYLPDWSIKYTAEEPGMGIYFSNDEEYIGKYCIDSCNEKVESNWEATEDTVRDIYKQVFPDNTPEPGKVFDIQDIISDLIDEDIYVHQWELCDLEECT